MKGPAARNFTCSKLAPSITHWSLENACRRTMPSRPKWLLRGKGHGRSQGWPVNETKAAPTGTWRERLELGLLVVGGDGEAHSRSGDLAGTKARPTAPSVPRVGRSVSRLKRMASTATAIK